TFGAYLNAFAMISPVYVLRQNLANWLGLTSEAPGLLLIFGLGFLVIPAVLLSLTGFLSRLLIGQSQESLGLTIRRFIYSLVPLGFSMWLAGGGIKGGQVVGATDEIGLHAVEKPYHFRDVHTTILHQLGLNQDALSYMHLGRKERLTEVHGHVIQEIV
ncbi:MAG: DUF1501 domain-containing protein, partial [Bryobacteraceae bacterium]|nr:DUF1501 domain-containing protein [Bryobacteraceae bacterium]